MVEQQKEDFAVVMDHEYMDRMYYQHMLNPLDYMDLAGLVNQHIPIKLGCIISWCLNRQQERNQLAKMILKIVSDKHYTDYDKDYVVNSIPYKEFADRGRAKDYMTYLGYDMFCVESSTT